ncbi:hypothetical protein [Flavobacterium beibuense]|uniref:hypothetical protein n=1 Tax=Flavobacterium beibuense TaxID=657326 RepID=UPI003A8E8084
MEKFRKKSFSYSDVSDKDTGVKVSEVLELVVNHKSYDEFYRLLEIDKIKDDFISIPGAKKLVETIRYINAKFVKFDLESTYNNLEFDTSDGLMITFKNIDDEEINELISSDEFTASPIYSAKSDFLSGLFSMEKYANKLMDSGYNDLVEYNLNEVKSIYENNDVRAKKYRILLDNDGNYFLRAITSNRYYDYNNNIAVFVGLITLHKEMLTSNNKFIVQRCEYNESYVRIYFESLEDKELPNVGYINNIIEVSNDEVKREAMRFSTVISLSYTSKEEQNISLFIKPQRTRSTILSIKHNELPKTAFEKLAMLVNYKEVQNELFEDLKRIGDIKKPDQIKHIIRNKINRARAGELKNSKNNILSELTTQVKTITELLELLNKIDLLTEDIDSKEYLRYIIYEALVYRK